MPSEVDLFPEFMIREGDIERGKPATEADVAGFENRYGVNLADDIKEFFLNINGSFVHGFIGIEELNEWCLFSEYSSRWGRRSNVENPENYFRFGHYDIFVWDWLIILSDKPQAPTPVFVWQYPGDKVVKIADSFSDFLRKYRIHGAESLLGYG